MMPKMVLMDGEKDGLEVPVSPAARPDVFWAVPNLDEDLIKKARGKTVKDELREKLSVLAYKFDPERSSGNRFRMYRCVELDRETTV